MAKPDAIVELVAKQHGVISRRQALESGFSSRQVDRAIARGEWIRATPGVYRHAAVSETWRSRLLVACLAHDAIASHRASARLHRIEGQRSPIVEVTVAHGRFRHLDGVRIHQSTQMDRADVAVIDEIPVTGLARTVLDFSAVSGMDRTNSVIDGLIRTKRLALSDLIDVLARHSRKGRDGCGRLRLALTDRIGETGVPRSEWSRLVGRLLTSHGLPKPSYEHPIVNRGGRVIAEVDLAYPRERVAIELDSVRWHLNRSSFERDPARRNLVVNEGWMPLTFTWSQYFERPTTLVATVARALAPRS